MTTGYNSSDPLRSLAYGYRSGSINDNANPFIVGAKEVSYNGFVFPPAIQAKGTIVQEYDKTGRTVKYLTIALTIECVITQFDQSGPVATSIGATIDRNMDTIRYRLSQPCQPLAFYLQGFGTILVQQNGLFDVDYGPKPQVLDWEPLGGGLAARIQWLVVTRIPACNTVPGLNGLIELGYEVSWSIGDAGMLNRTVSGYMERALTRSPNVGGGEASNSLSLLGNSATTQWETYLSNLRTTFPALPGFHRDEDYKEEANRKKLTFRFTDTEIPSPQAFPTGALSINLKESLSSTMNDGFRIWSWGISGDVTVPFGKRAGATVVDNKRACWAAIGMILRERRARGVELTFSSSKADVGVEQSLDTSKRYQHKVTFIPQRIKFDSDMFGVGISVDIAYMLICPSSLVLQASGMFDSVRIPGMTWENWRRFLEQNNIRVPRINPTVNQEMIVDLCHPLTSGGTPSIPSDSDYVNAGRRDSFIATDAPHPDNGWLRYNNRFEFKNKNFTVAGVAVSQAAYEQKEIVSPNADPQTEKKLEIVSGVSSVSSPKFLRPILQTNAENVCYVTMIGNAVRIGAPINAPNLESVGGKNVVKYGEDKITPESQVSGLRGGLGDNATVNIYKLSWRKTYVLTEPPPNWEIKTTGDPQAYQ